MFNKNIVKNYLSWHYSTVPKRLLNITDTLLQFFSHFFSIKLLLSTFFFPWHRVIETKKRRGWHLSEILQRSAFNILSSIIGAILRTFVLLIWVFISMETAALGIIAILIWLLVPGATIPLYYGERNKPQAIEIEQKQFVKKHSLSKETEKEALIWFNRFWTRNQRHFWQREVLFSIPSPTASWHYGYTTLLDKYSMDLAEHVNILEDRIIGRDNEIARLIRILSRKTQPAAILYGPTGSGRHAVVYEIARRIQTNDPTFPGSLMHFRVVKLDTTRLFGQYASAAQQRALLETIVVEVLKAGNIILVLDEIHMLTPNFDILAPAIQQGGVKLIGITTTKQYQRNLQKNEHIQKLFETLEIDPLAPQFVLRLLETKALELEKRLNVVFPIETLKRIVELGEKSQTPQPDSSLDLIEEIALIKRSSLLRSERLDLGWNLITPRLVNKLAEEKLKIPISAMGSQERRKLANLESLLHEYVVNQQAAVSGLANALRRARLELQSPKRPLASFLFLGPTGVGKTETTKALSRVYFADKRLSLKSIKDSAFYNRFDMSNYQTKQDANRLITQLAYSITDQPYGVLLLDEIEKAHPDILNIFLTIIDEGYFTDLEGDKVSCRNLFVIGTSNAASEFIRKLIKSDAFNEIESDTLSNEVIEYVLRNNIFSPEFINRFDAVIVFEPLGKPQLRQIAQMKLEKLNQRLQKKHNTSIEITDELIDKIIEKGYKPEFGAREIKRAIQTIVENPLAKKLLEE